MVERASQAEAGSRSFPAWGLFAALLALALVLTVVAARYREPAPRTGDVPPDEFSAGRARAVLEEVLGTGAPRPVGSAENARSRARLVAVLKRLGYEPEVQATVGCRSEDCAPVRNVLFRLPGHEPGGVVLVVAHYDSVAAGPGVGDDLAAVAAAIEVARAMRRDRRPRNSFVFLLDDGEEAGLLGAQAFVAEHPLAREVDAVLNAEARGTSGASLMFETDRDNAWLVGLYAGAAPRPLASSLFSTIYERMPNDTDFTVFKGAGMRGLNFAFIGHPGHYHTPLDNLENLSLGSLQHHGDNLLSTARALADADLTRPPRGAAVFFDVLGYGMVRWPAQWTVALAALALLLLAGAAVRFVRRGEARAAGIVWGLLAFLLMLAAAGLAGWLLGWGVLGRGAYAAGWVAEPAAAAPFWLLALAAVIAAARLCRRGGAWSLWIAVWSVWAVLGVATAMALPGVSFLFLVPALLAGIAALAAPALPALAALLPLAAAAALWFPILRFLPHALGAGILPSVTALVALATTGLAPLAAAGSRRSGRAAVAGLAVAALLAAGWALSRPGYSAGSPRALNLGFHQEVDVAGRPVVARFFAAGPWLRLPPELAAAAEWEQARRSLYPWGGPWGPWAPARPLPLAPPEAIVAADGQAGGDRRLLLRLVSRRGAPIAGVALPPEAEVRRLTVAGRPMPEEHARGWRVVTFTGMPVEGIDVEVVLGAAGPLDFWAFDRSYGLPPGGERLARRRPAMAVPINNGDMTVLTRKVRLPATL
jgi:Peptidase family M28